MRKWLLILLSLASFLSPAIAQYNNYLNEDADDDPYEHKSYFMFGVNYMSDNVYLGRKDSVRVPYTSPYIGYHFDNGLYAKAMVSFTPAKKRYLDLTTLEVGYDHSFTSHLNGGINIDKVYYNKNSTNVRANTKGYGGIYAQYSNDWIEPQISLDANINKNSTDYVVNYMLDHDFKLDGNKVHLIPIVAMNMGTQHYYDEYFINRLTKTDKTIKVKKVVADADKFNTLDYELSMKGTYMAGKWLFTLIPTYAIPVNPAVITLPKRTVNEKISKSFYVEMDICHR